MSEAPLQVLYRGTDQYVVNSRALGASALRVFLLELLGLY